MKIFVRSVCLAWLGLWHQTTLIAVCGHDDEYDRVRWLVGYARIFEEENESEDWKRFVGRCKKDQKFLLAGSSLSIPLITAYIKRQPATWNPAQRQQMQGIVKIARKLQKVDLRDFYLEGDTADILRATVFLQEMIKDDGEYWGVKQSRIPCFCCSSLR
jgi:hypothetical protein